MPRLNADLRPNDAQALWIMDSYGFMIAGFLITMGTLGDRIGRRRLLMIGATAFAAASVVTAYSTSAEILIAARALLGVAGATIAPSTLALISNMFVDPQQRGIAIGVWVSYYMVGMAIGPVVGGVVIEHFWWGAVFMLGVPAMVLLLVTGPWLLPEYRNPDASRLDPLSVTLSLAMMTPAVYGVKELALSGAAVGPALALLVGAAAGVLFVCRQLWLTDPLIDIRLFRDVKFIGALAILLFGTAVVGGLGLFVNQYLQMVQMLSPMGAGWWLVPPAIATVVGAVAAPTVAERIRPGYAVGAGAVLMVIGSVLLTQLSRGPALLVLIVGFTIVLLGYGPIVSLGTALIMTAPPPEKAGRPERCP